MNSGQEVVAILYTYVYCTNYYTLQHSGYQNSPYINMTHDVCYFPKKFQFYKAAGNGPWNHFIKCCFALFISKSSTFIFLKQVNLEDFRSKTIKDQNAWSSILNDLEIMWFIN